MSDAKADWIPDYVLIFDGGSRGNPGPGYGSYLLKPLTGEPLLRRLDFGDGVTNNEAEYRALIQGLRDLVALLTRRGNRPEDLRLEVRGDSSLVINQLEGRWRVRKAELAPLHAEARALLDRFAGARLLWTPRAYSVAAVGH